MRLRATAVVVAAMSCLGLVTAGSASASVGLFTGPAVVHQNNNGCPPPPLGPDGKPRPLPTGPDGRPLPPPTGADGKPCPPPIGPDGKPLPPPPRA